MKTFAMIPVFEKRHYHQVDNRPYCQRAVTTEGWSSVTKVQKLSLNTYC